MKNIYRNLVVKLPRKKVACGMFSHWDSLITSDENLLKLIKNSKKKKPEKILIERVREVMYALESASRYGGVENLISKKIYLWLNSKFQNRKKILGGNGNNFGSTLFKLGLRAIVSYPCRPRELMVASPDFRVALEGKLVPPKMAIRMGDENYEHFIFEFPKGRQIFSWDMMTRRGILDHHFLEVACNAKFVDLLILGYAHLLLPKFKKRTDRILEFFHQRRPHVHLEFGHGCKESMIYAMKKFVDCGCVDSFGMNGMECMDYLGAKNTSLEELQNVSLDAIRKFGLTRICVHTQKFVFSISKIDWKEELYALASACLVSAAKTFGKFDLESAKKLPVSMGFKKDRIDSYNFVLVPCLTNRNPERTVGLGDAFTAVQAVKVFS